MMPEPQKPKLYNWVRAIKNISLLSASYTALVAAASIGLFFSMGADATNQEKSNFLIAPLIASILITLLVRRFSLQKFIRKFRTNFHFELILASWCILLILLHLQCQLLFLMMFRSSIGDLTAALMFAFGVAVIILSWPKLQTIQSLLKTKPL
jgi:hypothetical protein